nr:NADP-dependent oxidoreductase domain-containing protein 1 isoform X2 [Geotrypetes seraphini]XP_033807529.1 NADP-dependent oxidoreductase domain-containing protein 1 isoform X2 [Geotrypetes seraphini]
MSDFSANLPSFQFEKAVEVCHHQFLPLRERSRGIMLNACSHAVFLCKLLDVFSQIEEPENIPLPLNLDSKRERLKVGIIGGGHTGKQLAKALLELSGLLAEHIQISTRRPETLQELLSLGVNCFYHNRRLAAWAKILFLCCLPSQLPSICSEIQKDLPESSIVYSLVSSVPISRLKQLLCHSSILRPEYQYEANDDSHIWGTSGKITAALHDEAIVQATCPWHPGGGLAANTRWFAAVIYAALNSCSNQTLPYNQSLQLLNNLLCHILGTSKGEEKSYPSFVRENFVSQRFAASLQNEDAFPRFDLTAIHQKDTPFSKLLVSSPALQDHLLQVYCTTLGVSLQAKEDGLPSFSSEPCVSSQIPEAPVEVKP